MSTTPYQTYLEERLQSARGLGWEATVGCADGRTAPPSFRPLFDAVRLSAHRILRFWFGFAR